MTSRKTCDKCAHYTPEDTYNGTYPAHGSCAKACDWNEVSHNPAVFVDQVAGWDYESYRAGVHVAPKFGCIHWAKKAIDASVN